MGKLVAHLALAAALWFGLGAVDLHVGLRILAVVLGAIGIHLVWERVFYDPFVHLGVMPIHQDDPLMKEAVSRARSEFPRFLGIYPEHKEDTIVRFPFTTVEGTVEHLWGDLVEVSGDRARVFTRTIPTTNEEDFEPGREIALADITDWQVEMRDGTLRGGYTNRAAFKIFERTEGMMPALFKEHLARFRDL